MSLISKPIDFIQNCLSNNGLKITLKLKRRSINGIIQIIIPSLVLWLCAMLTLQYDVNDLTNRNRTSVTTLLVLVTLFGAINNKSDFPKTSGFKHIDVWFVWYLINIFLIIWWVVFVHFCPHLTIWLLLLLYHNFYIYFGAKCLHIFQ